MVAWSYGISLRVFNSISHELNRSREIPYLRAPMYYTLYAYLKLKTVKTDTKDAYRFAKTGRLERRAGKFKVSVQVCDQLGRPL